MRILKTLYVWTHRAAPIFARIGVHALRRVPCERDFDIMLVRGRDHTRRGELKWLGGLRRHFPIAWVSCWTCVSYLSAPWHREDCYGCSASSCMYLDRANCVVGILDSNSWNEFASVPSISLKGAIRWALYFRADSKM